jgi:hypothetical protein
MEYNSVFGDEKPWTIPYQPDFYRTNAHHSNLYFGASIQSLCDLANEKGYIFVGSNSAGNNAYFVKKDLVKDLKQLTAKEGYIKSQFRESRDADGRLTYISEEERIKEIKGLKIFNTKLNKVDLIK